MAVDTTITENIDLAVNGSALDPAFKRINDQINAIARKIVEIGVSAQNSANGVNKKFDLELKKISRQLSQVQTLEKLLNEQRRQGSRAVSGISAEQSLGKRAIAAAKYEQSVRNATNALEVLEARQNSLVARGAKIASEGLLPNKAFLTTKRNVDAAVADLKRLERSYADLNAKAKAAGGDFSPQRSAVLSAMSSVRGAASDGRRSNFTDELQTLQAALTQYKTAIADASLSPTKMLGLQKRDIADQIRAMTSLHQLDEARAANQVQIRTLKQAINSGEERNLRILHDQLELEYARERAIERQTRAVQKQNSTEARASAPKAGGENGISSRRAISNILSPGYAAAAFARTSVYGAAAMGAYSIFDAIRGGGQFVTEFEDGMGRLQAITGSTDTQMGKLSETILGVSRSSRFATKDLVEAATVLGQAGLSTKEIAQTLESVSKLAAASGSSIQQTTDVVTSALGAFQMGAEQTARVADILTTSLNNSKLNLEQVALGIQYAGQTAHENNVSFEELVATIATMSQAGIRSGSTQGTGLRQFLIDLQSPSKKLSAQLKELGISFEDINVKTRGLPAVLQTLQEKGFGASEAYASLETRGAAAYLVLKNNTDEINRQIIAQQQMGVTNEAAAKSMNTLAAQWQRFKNNLGADTTGATSGLLATLVSWLKETNDQFERQIVLQKELQRTDPSMTLDRFTIATTNTNIALTAMNGHLSQAYKLWDSRQKLRAFAEETDFAAKMGEEFSRSLEGTKTAVADTNAEIQSHQTTIKSLNEAISSVRLKQDNLKDGSLALKAETASLTGRFEGLGVQLGGTVTSVEQLISAMYRLKAAQAAALQGEYFKQYGQLTLMSAQATQNVDKASEAANRKLGSDHPLARLIGQLNTGSAESKDRAAKILQSTIGRMSTSNPYRSIASSALSQYGTKVTSENQAQQIAEAYAGSSFLQTPKGRRYQSWVNNVMGGTSAQKSSVYDSLTKIGNSRGVSGAERAAIMQLQSELTASISSDPPQAPASSNRSSGGNAAANRAARNETFVSKDNLSLIEDELRDQLDKAKKAATTELYDAANLSSEKLLNEWVDATREVADDELKQKKIDPDSPLGKRYKAQTERQITAKRQEVAEALVDGFINTIEKNLDQIDVTYKNLQYQAEARQNVLQGRLSGLDRYSLRNRVTDADKILAQRDIAREEENVQRATLANLTGQEREKTAVRDQAALAVSGVRAQLAAKPGDAALSSELKLLENNLREVDTQLQEVRKQKEALSAAFAADQDLPVTFTQRLRTAIDAYAEANGLTRTFSEEIGSGLMTAVGSAHDAFSTFFTDIVSGTRSVGSAFGNMALSVLKALNQMVAQAAANQLFSALLGLVGGALGAPALGKAKPGTLEYNFDSAFGLNRYNGGKIAGFDSGGKVMNGSIGRDSVNAKLAKDEWVIRRSAAQSVGDDFLNDLNKRGSAALKDLKAPGILAMKTQAPPTNVYVVSPEHKEQMGPNDVLVVLQDDILRGGVTKKLIRAVAAGS